MIDYSKLTLGQLLDCQAEIKRLVSDLENRIKIQGNCSRTEEGMLKEYMFRFNALNRLILEKSELQTVDIQRK